MTSPETPPAVLFSGTDEQPQTEPITTIEHAISLVGHFQTIMTNEGTVYAWGTGRLLDRRATHDFVLYRADAEPQVFADVQSLVPNLP